MPSGQVPGRYAAPSIDPRDGGTGEVIIVLHLQPGVRGSAKCLFQADRHVGADGRLLVDDVVQGLARHAQDLRRTLDCQAQ
jgi:hypothetical protein